MSLDINELIDHIIDKNDELYRRLAEGPEDAPKEKEDVVGEGDKIQEGKEETL